MKARRQKRHTERSPQFAGWVAFHQSLANWLFAVPRLPCILQFSSGYDRVLRVRGTAMDWIEELQELFHDPLFWTSLYNTFYYVVLAVPLGVAVAIILASGHEPSVREVSHLPRTFIHPKHSPDFCPVDDADLDPEPTLWALQLCARPFSPPGDQLARRYSLFETRNRAGRTIRCRADRTYFSGGVEGDSFTPLRCCLVRRCRALAKILAMLLCRC